MAEPFLGEIRYVAFSYAPRGWALCNGAVLSIAQNSALFSLLGTSFGGNGTSTFCLPDLRGRVGAGAGAGQGLSSYTVGQMGGAESYAIQNNEMGRHTHLMAASPNATSTDPLGAFLGSPAGEDAFLYTTQPDSNASPAMIAPDPGGGQAHENRQPSLAVMAIISLQGIYPSRS